MKLSKKELKRMREARIQLAVSGFVIPMMSIPAIYKALEAEVAESAPLAKLKSIVAGFPGVKESV